jgi:3',5'-cyclic AMP phosphodiesterase CpdA
MADDAIRLAHVSDVHLFCRTARWTMRDWFTKLPAGWINNRFWPRAVRFREAASVLEALVADVQECRPDLLIFSGDATALGFEEEFAEAARLFRVGDSMAVPGLAVPGNHDYYTPHSAARGYFENYFAPWLDGERLDGARYPFARRVGPVYLIAVNSAKPNRWPWDATGRVDAEQLDRLRRLLALPHIAACPRIIVTHYPICLANGDPETKVHGLRGLAEVVKAAQAGGVGLWLHGHRHHPYAVFSSPLSSIPSICAGSGTQRDCWSYSEYSLDGPTLGVERRRFDRSSKRFISQEQFSWELPAGQPNHFVSPA